MYAWICVWMIVGMYGRMNLFMDGYGDVSMHNLCMDGCGYVSMHEFVYGWLWLCIYA
jgi:hypothetical protein